MEAYSLDLRRRIVRACEEGSDTRLEIADAFDVSLSFVHKLWRRWTSSRLIEAMPRGKGPSPTLRDARHLAAVRRLLSDAPDATLTELCVGLADSGGPRVSRSTMCRAVAAMDLPLKKSRHTPASAIRRESARYAAGTGGGWRIWT